MNDFDGIAPFYDFLGRLVFGNELLKSQAHYLEEIKAGSKILLIGGGTGKILKEFEKLEIPLSIDYIEKSEKMLLRSKALAPFENLAVNFIQGDHNGIPKTDYNVIFTAFFLDVFDSDTLGTVIQKLDQVSGREAIWIVTDFIRTRKHWQRILIYTMYRFFRLLTRMQGRKLLNFETFLAQKGLISVKSKVYFYGMIRTVVYQYQNA